MAQYSAITSIFFWKLWHYISLKITLRNIKCFLRSGRCFHGMVDLDRLLIVLWIRKAEQIPYMCRTFLWRKWMRRLFSRQQNLQRSPLSRQTIFLSLISTKNTEKWNNFYHHNHIDNFLVRLNYSWWGLGWLGPLEGLWCHMRWWKSDTWTHVHRAILWWCPMQRFLEWYTRVQHVPMSR